MNLDNATITDETPRFLINDTYRTDVHLLYPPYIISLAVLYIGFCLTAFSNPSGTRTRSTSTQSNTLSSTISANNLLNLEPPPTSAAEFLASFEVSLPVLLACVQDIIVLYPIWENFEPFNNSSRSAQAQAGASTMGVSAKAHVEGRDKFGAEEAEALVRRMIEERMVDVGHPDDAGRADEGLSTGNTHIAGKKRGRA